MHKSAALSIVVSLVCGASPALAQYSYPSRTERVADGIARTVEETARAVGRVRDSVDRSLDGVRFRGPERYAIEACRPLVERYGQMRVDQVQPYRRRGFRVYGATGGYGSGYQYDYPAYRDGYRNRPRSFTCTVRDDGRAKLKTRRLRRY
jgi:hypothetical protein